MNTRSTSRAEAVVDHMPALLRLEAFSPIAEADRALLATAARTSRLFQPNEEIVAAGDRVDAMSMLVSGWALRTRCFADGRRQILGLLLPGDLLGQRREVMPRAAAGVVAATAVALADVPTVPPGSPLARACAVGAAMEEVGLYRQIARLGRLSAYERVIDLMLEMHEQLMLAGLVEDDTFSMPLTQEMLGDVLGLTSVHVNRTLMTLRREGLLELRAGRARLGDVARLAERVEFTSAFATTT